MRIIDIVLFMVLFSAVTSIFDDTTWFGGGSIPLEDLKITESEMDKLNSMTPATDTGTIGTAAAALKAAWTGTIFLMNMLSRVVFIDDVIINIFTTNLAPGTPEYEGIVKIAFMIQAGVYVLYALGVYQLWKGVSTAHMQ